LAYDALKDTDEDSGNPYSGTLTSFGAAIQGQTKASAPQQTAPVNNALGNAAGQSATGYVNFDSLYNANADVAHREAGKRTDAAEKAAQGAQAARTGAQQSFSDAVRTGTLATPEQQHYAWRDHGATGVQHGKQVTSADHDTKGTYDGAEAKQGHVTEQNEGLESSVTRTSGAPPDAGPVSPLAPKAVPTGAPTSSFYDTANDAAIEAQVRERAKAEYAGPDSLAGTDGYEELLQETVAAQDLANNPLTGLGDTDRALLGAAGRPRMAELQQKYGGLTKELDAANVASKAEADSARKATDETADVYEEMLALYEGRKGEEQAGEDRATQRSEDVMANAAKKSDNQTKFNEYIKSRSNVRNVLHEAAKKLSLSEYILNAAGEQGLTERLTNKLTPMSSTNKDNVSWQWGDDDADVYGSMTDADWMEFAALSDAEKRAWIEERKKKLRGGG
jgi:hypothetical protein